MATQKYPEYMMEVLRQRRGLEKDDKSEDARFEEFSPSQVVREMSKWHLGCGDWAETFEDWFRDAGFKITPSLEDE